MQCCKGCLICQRVKKQTWLPSDAVQKQYNPVVHADQLLTQPRNRRLRPANSILTAWKFPSIRKC